MELPNYSKQLMQQLWTLRKEGHFCDCTILVGDSPHRAHKLVLAASSMLFRSLLEGSDTISIDTTVVSSQDFGSLLDMVYTGRLPLGKHNVSRIVAAADSLQMFDVAVGFKNILTSLINPPAVGPSAHTQVDKLTSLGDKGVASPIKGALISGKAAVKVEVEVEEVEEERNQRCSSGTEGSPCKRARAEASEPEEAKPLLSLVGGTNVMMATVSSSSSVLLKRSSELMQLLSNVPSVLELLSQAALSSLEEQERQVVCQCCEQADAGPAMERLMSSMRQGVLSEAGVLTLLRTLQEKSPSCFPPQLISLLEEAERHMQPGDGEEPADEDPHTVTVAPNESPPVKRKRGRPPKNAPKPPTKSDRVATATAGPEQQNSTNTEEEQEENLEGETEAGKKPEAAATENTEGDGDMPYSPASSTTSSSPSQPYSCRWCKKGFAYKCRLLSHLKRCSMSQEFKQKCPLCPEVLGNPRALRHHRAQAHPEAARVKKKVACDLCGRTFAHPSGMIYHKRTEHFDEKPFACEECGAKFGANSSLKNHMRLHTGEKPYHCKHCDMSFSVAAALAYHTKKKHSEGKMYACQYCEATFAQSIELTRHVRTHTGDRPYVCRECGKGYSQASGLTVHLHTSHNISEPHDCQKCCLTFPSLEEHRQHIQECHPKDFHKCPVCHKGFISAALLDKHKSTHAATKPFSCDLCHKSYQQLSGLWYHNRTTHPEVFASQTSSRQLKTLVQCDICFKFFPNAASLSKHQEAEHPDPAAFSTEEELQEHDSSAFGCSLCSLVYPTQLQLQEHVLSCHMRAPAEEQASTSHTAILTQMTGNEGAETVISLDQSQLGSAQQVFVALGDGKEGSSSEVVAVNMDDLLNGSVTFICEDKSLPNSEL